MTATEPEDLSQTIRLALAAAEAANDAAGEATRAGTEMDAAAARIDRAGARMRPLALGLLAGTVAALGLGGLVTWRTLSDMNLATAAQIEALALFSTRVAELTEQVEATRALGDRLTALETALAEGQAGAETAAVARDEALTALILAESEAGRAATAQYTAGLADGLTATQTALEGAVLGANSDLQLALTRLLADGAAAAPGTSGGTAPRLAEAPATAPATSPTPRPRPRTTAPQVTRAPAPNPFSYP